MENPAEQQNETDVLADMDVSGKGGRSTPKSCRTFRSPSRSKVGRASLKIRDLLRLAQGSVVELDRLAGEPLDLLVNQTVVAQGEIVLVNDRYGIRLTRVVPAAERLKQV